MLFVNEIGEIVHGIVDKYSGAANKNIGDAFLLVWKFEEADQITDPETGELHVKECGRVSQLADMSVLSFVLLIAGSFLIGLVLVNISCFVVAHDPGYCSGDGQYGQHRRDVLCPLDILLRGVCSQ